MVFPELTTEKLAGFLLELVLISCILEVLTEWRSRFNSLTLIYTCSLVCLIKFLPRCSCTKGWFRATAPLLLLTSSSSLTLRSIGDSICVAAPLVFSLFNYSYSSSLQATRPPTAYISTSRLAAEAWTSGSGVLSVITAPLSNDLDI